MCRQNPHILCLVGIAVSVTSPNPDDQDVAWLRLVSLWQGQLAPALAAAKGRSNPVKFAIVRIGVTRAVPLLPERATGCFRSPARERRDLPVLMIGSGLDLCDTLCGMDPTEARVALNMLPRLGPVRLRSLLDTFGSAEAVLRAPFDRLCGVDGVGPEVARSISSWESSIDLAEELRRAADFGATILTQDNPEYPRLLRTIHDPPTVLYVWGRVEERDGHAVGVVGSRRTTHYGLESAKKLSYQLAYAGLTVVSGLARGIDTAAHQGALAAKGRTIAVIGAGLEELYPPENAALAEKIAAQGAVVSEFPMSTKPDRQTFPMRNRIVSGWSFGLLVVEAGLNSGALITANQAADQNRSLYAVPGPIDRPSSQGTNRLIQQGAKLVTGAGDILEDMQMLFPNVPELPQSRPAAQLTENEQAIYDALGEGETDLDDIVTKSGLPIATLSSTLLALEIKKLVKPLPGQRYVRLL